MFLKTYTMQENIGTLLSTVITGYSCWLSLVTRKRSLLSSCDELITGSIGMEEGEQATRKHGTQAACALLAPDG